TSPKTSRFLFPTTSDTTSTAASTSDTTTKAKPDKKEKSALSPGEKQRIKQQDRMSMQALATHAAFK
ncbi:hypothetical protein D6D19_06324, partial [Aureobasidium pullulans]